MLGLDYSIQYKRGVENKVADALSRREHEPAGEVNGFSLVIPTWVQDVIHSDKGDPFCTGGGSAGPANSEWGDRLISVACQWWRWCRTEMRSCSSPVVKGSGEIIACFHRVMIC